MISRYISSKFNYDDTKEDFFEGKDQAMENSNYRMQLRYNGNEDPISNYRGRNRFNEENNENRRNRSQASRYNDKVRDDEWYDPKVNRNEEYGNWQEDVDQTYNRGQSRNRRGRDSEINKRNMNQPRQWENFDDDRDQDWRRDRSRQSQAYDEESEFYGRYDQGIWRKEDERQDLGRQTHRDERRNSCRSYDEEENDQGRSSMRDRRDKEDNYLRRHERGYRGHGDRGWQRGGENDY